MTAQPLVDVCVAQRPSDYLISTNQPLCLRLWIAWIIPFACNRCLKPDGRDVAVASLWLHLLEFRKPNLASASVGAFVFAHAPSAAWGFCSLHSCRRCVGAAVACALASRAYRGHGRVRCASL